MNSFNDLATTLISGKVRQFWPGSCPLYHQSVTEINLLYRHECFTGKHTTRKIHTKPHPGLEWRIFHILTSEDIDAAANIKFVS